MLSIRQSQIDIMMQPKQQTAAWYLAQQLSNTPYFQHFSEKQLQLWVNRQIDYLAKLNIYEKKNVHDIIDILAVHGDNFERLDNPKWALTIINDKEQNESIRSILLKRANKKFLAALCNN